MSVKRISRVVMTGCLTAILLPAGGVFAGRAIGPTLTFGNAAPAATGPLLVAPWFDKSVIFVRVDGTFQVAPIARSAPTTTLPSVPLSPQTVERPGTVGNLRRVDRR